MVDPCRNPRCDFFDTCPLRPAADDLPMGNLPPGPGPNGKPDARFEIENDFCGRIGRLYVRGEIGKAILPVIGQFERLLTIIDGAFVVLESTGGSRAGETHLIEIVEKASAIMPTVVYIREACSAAFSAAMAATRTYARHDARLGALGTLLKTCDGNRPTTLVSRQTPAKHDGSPLPPRIFAQRTDQSFLQESIDRQFIETVKEICRHRQCTTESIIRLLDGRTFDAKEAVAVGLIDGAVFGELDAFEMLANLIYERNRNV